QGSSASASGPEAMVHVWVDHEALLRGPSPTAGAPLGLTSAPPSRPETRPASFRAARCGVTFRSNTPALHRDPLHRCRRPGPTVSVAPLPEIALRLHISGRAWGLGMD